jgi:hypothetical protein
MPKTVSRAVNVLVLGWYQRAPIQTSPLVASV